ncbi:YobA family protein [Bacillus sp. H-16]|uniref:DUF3221 domain-containing protein n=1 Tax=Alteribacter salitolerans TaxID=2912333 RepID=UPI001962CC36|nr:DUF3221 domain-containing protein [Alteribacter salitolerans]MBM7095073.1 YobA family protein [Alteribacter salitolerans]
MNPKYSILFIAIIFLTACGTNGSSSEGSANVIEGRIVEIKETSILVVEDITEAKAIELTSDTLMDAEAGAAYWFSDAENAQELQEGLLVRVKTGAIAESYPAQGEALSVEVVEE